MPGPPDPADARQARAAMADQRIDQRAGGMARRRMDDEPRGLVDDDEVLVLVDDGQRDVLADQRRIPPPPAPRSRCSRPRRPWRRIARDAAVDR